MYMVGACCLKCSTRWYLALSSNLDANSLSSEEGRGSCKGQTILYVGVQSADVWKCVLLLPVVCQTRFQGCVHSKPVPRRCTKKSSFEQKKVLWSISKVHYHVLQCMLPSYTILHTSRCSVLLTAITLLRN